MMHHLNFEYFELEFNPLRTVNEVKAALRDCEEHHQADDETIDLHPSVIRITVLRRYLSILSLESYAVRMFDAAPTLRYVSLSLGTDDANAWTVERGLGQKQSTLIPLGQEERRRFIREEGMNQVDP